MSNPPTHLASRDKRLGASMLDTLFLLIVLLPVLYLAGTLTGLLEALSSGKEIHQTVGERMVGVLLGIAAYLLLNGWPLFTRGQTLGKYILKIKVVDLEGNHPGFNRLFFIRYLIPLFISDLSIAPTWMVIVDVVFIFRSEHRCLHDYLAGTRVVNI